MNQQHIILYKNSSNGKPLIWEAIVNDNTVTYRFGILGGKIQEKIDIYHEGKNVGRANATTPQQQAALEALATAKKKMDGGYALKIEDQGTIVPKPMLAKVYADYKHRLTTQVWISPKLDGLRCVGDTQTGKLYSRTGKEILGVPHINEAILKLKMPSDIRYIDGELYTHGKSFEELSSLIRPTKNIKTEESKKVFMYVFDCISSDPYSKRIQIITDAITTSTIIPYGIVPIETYLIEKRLIDEYHAKFMADGFEGTMIRSNTQSGYKNKRTDELLKKKDFLDEEFEVIGFEKALFANTLGACILKTKNGHVFNATPAVPLKQKDYIWEHQQEFLGKIATVKYQEYTQPREGNHIVPRFPVLICFRSEE